MLLILLVTSAQGAWAQSGEWKDYAANGYASGEGTEANPYVINTAAQLAYLAKEVSNTQNASVGKYYVLGADIDLGAHYWNPIGDGHENYGVNDDAKYRFKGNFDGKGHVIKNMHLQWIASNKWSCVGLFGRILGDGSSSWARVKNLVIDNANVVRKSGDLTGSYYMIGILAGEACQYAEISNVIVKNSVNSDGANDNSLFEVKSTIRVGGVLGNTENKNNKYRIFNIATENVTVDFSHTKYNSNSTSYIGAIVGRFNQQTGTDAKYIFAKNIFSDVTIKFDQSKVKKGTVKRGNVLAIDGGTNAPDNWYYTNSFSSSETNATNYGEKKVLASYGSTFINQANDFLTEKNMSDMPCWGYGQTSGFVLIGSFSGSHESTHLTNAHVYSINTTGSFTYEWYVDGVRQSSTTNKATLTTKTVEQNGRVVVKNGSEKLLEKNFVIPAEIYGVEDHICAANYGGGRGTQVSPYLISNDAQLAKLAFDINNGKNLDKYFKLTADIDLSKAVWTPMGSVVYNTNNTFKGTLDGNGHVISNMNFYWNESKKDKDNCFGLFSTIGGGTVRNLIIDNAKAIHSSNSDLVGAPIVGILAGCVYKNSKIQNIIIRKSKIEATAFYQNEKWVIVGGTIGKIVDSSNNYKFDNIATDVEINLNSLNISNYDIVYVGGFIAECQPNVKTCVNNVYAHGKISVNNSCANVGSVFGIYFDNVSQKTLYYANEARLNQGTQKSFSGFAVPFCEANNEFVESSGDDALSSWNYDKSTGVFYFTLYGTELLVEYKDKVVITAKTLGMSGNEQYNWYISEDKVNWKKSNLSTTKILSLPYDGNIRYVYAEVSDESSRSKSAKISTIIKADAYLAKTNNTYRVNLTNSLWDDNQHLTVSYQWMVNGSNVSATGNTYTPSGANDKVSCHVTLSSGQYTILDKTLYSGTVVFLKPAGGNNDNDGLTPDTPVKTWQKAYSLLNAEGSWDENTIVLMGLSNAAATGSSGGFAITNNIVNNVPSELYPEWKEKVNASNLAKNATITGKYNGVDYGAIIEGSNYRNKQYISLFGDTRFEYITFHHTNSAPGDGGNHSQYIFCQYYNLEMGEGIQMTGYVPEDTPGYGSIDGARVVSMQIYGGLNNDARFRSGNGVLDMEAMEEAMPHGKKGFSITLKSGRYSTVTVGGRQSTGSQLNGLMGTPNLPIKCTITIDIDREFNDNHNEANADYDCGIVLAGCHEGAMYADVDIILKSGYVGRVVNGTLGQKRNYQFSYDNKTYTFPSNTYAGRANILLDPRDGEGKIDNNKVIVTELYGGSTGRGYSAKDVIDNPFYGFSTVTINGGTFKVLPENNKMKESLFCGIFGSGAGGYNGIGDDTHHTVDEKIAYWSPDNKVVLFGKYDVAKNNLVSVKCYNADDNYQTPTTIDPRDTKTKILIKDGVFGTDKDHPIDGVYAGGSGFMSPSLFFANDVVPSVAGGNVYGKVGQIVSSLTIKGGTFYCKNGIFAGGRGTDEFYSNKKIRSKDYNYGIADGNHKNYNALGQTYGDVELIINGGTFNCDIFGGGYGVADAKLYNTNTYATLSNMARVYGKTTVVIDGNTEIKGSVYGGGDMAAVENGTLDATDLKIMGNVVVNGNVFASGNGRTKNDTQNPDLVGFVKGNANLYITDTPRIYGDIYGGGAYGSNEGNTSVIADGGYFYRNVYGGGQGDLDSDTRATIKGNASVTMSGAKAALTQREIDTNTFTSGMHNVYGGGLLVATVTGTASVNVTRSFAPDSDDEDYDPKLLEMWESAWNDNSKLNFWVLGGGYGVNTITGNTDVNINIDIDKNNKIIGSAGGSYAGVVEHNTSTTIQGIPVLRNVYGGGYGLLSTGNASTGIVKENSTVVIEGGKMYCNVFGGGKGIFQTASDDTYKDVARVKGNTSVTVTGTAEIYGNVYGGGDIANVGDGTVGSGEPISTSISNGEIVDYTHNNSRTFVNVTGGNVYGMVFGGGLGRTRSVSGVGANYTKIGKVTGNTLVHVANSKDADDNTVEPYIWNRIYGAGSYGIVDGSSKVHIEGGNLGYNIFGGGFGDIKGGITSADVNGNTYVTIDGGSWIWYAMADVDGNITTWDKANTKLSTSYEKMRSMTEAERMTKIQSYVDDRFFENNDGGYRFVINHNIYGGGNAACNVSGTAKVEINHSPLTDVKYKGKTYNLLDPNTAAGCCWYTSMDNIRNPQFSVFGAGYGVNTKVKSTEVYAQPGSKLNAEGKAVGGKRYLNQPEDQIKYEVFEQTINDNYQAVDDNTRRRLYGMGENTNDPRTYLRYRASQLAWSIGAPAFTFMDIHGGGFSGYVTGNTKVVTDCQLTCRSVFGGGIGSKPDGTPSGSETYGQVDGNTDVKIYGGVISMNVFGGGAGIEPYTVNGVDKAFPDMARVKGKTNVDVYGEWYKIDGMDVERTLIFGSVYGGGDVANVGTSANTTKQQLTGSESFTTKVNIKGASVMSPVFAGGNGRNKSSHYDYTKLGAVYGNAGLFVNETSEAYPYDSNSGTLSTPVIPYLWSRAYGGGNKGIINGNTLVKIDNGYFSDDIFAGGLGDAQANTANSTSADVKGHTNLIVNGGEAKLTSLWNPVTRAWVAATSANNHLYSPQYDPEKRKFKVNHNMYGGGNLACVVEGNSYITMTKGMLNNQETVSATANPDGGFFATKEWKEVYYKTGSPYFCVFGGGYGKQAVINGSTNLDVALEDNNNHVHIEDIPDRVEGEEYLHFIPNQSVMDIVGGGYEGKVIGQTNVNIAGGTFARRVFGGGQYNSVYTSNVNINSIDCEDVFGGGMMGDIEKTVYVNIGKEGAAANENIHIHGNVYGGNDVAGYVNLKDKDATGATVFQDNGGEGVKLKIRGGHIYGNVYGAGNGDYLYALDKAGNTSPTVNEYYVSGNNNKYDLVFTVPMRSTIATNASSATEAQKIVNLNSWRPLTNKVIVDIAGKSASSKPDIRGNVYGGGNSATVVDTNEPNEKKSHVILKVGSYIKLGGLFLGCDGEQLFTQTDTKDYIRAINDIDKIDVNSSINWNTDAIKNIQKIYLPGDADTRKKAYPHILDLYFQPVAMSIRPQIIWADNLTTDTIGSFVCGGNRGNMDIVPDDNGNAVKVEFPAGLTITDKIVGGCYNANYVKNNSVKVDHVGGYLLGESRSISPMIDLTVKCKFAPSVVEKSGKTYYEGGNVYGGCYQSGVIVGDVKIDYRSNSLKGLDEALLTVSNENDIAACNIYGAGYGEDSYVYGDIDVLYSNQVPWSNNSGTTVNNVFGGGQKGNVIGNTDIRILNGKIHGSVTGGSYSGYLWGSAQVLVGYPKYYLCKKSSKYDILRADDASANLAMENTYYNANGEKYTTRTIKQSLYIMAGDIVSEQVVDAINDYDAKNGTLQVSDAFDEKITKPSDYGLSWSGININIGVAVYGGGYSTAASGTSLNNTTVLRYTEKYNNVDMNYSGSKNGNSNYASGMDPELTVDAVKNYGGNTTMLIADDPSYMAEHITISPQTMKVATGLADNADLFQKYYMGTDNNYHFISVEGKYFKNGSVAAGTWPADISETDHKFYEADTEGGIFGDGHLSYTEGFRNCELSGYGYASHSVSAGKILNTFQRLDMLRLKDNCIKLLGARDYATSSTDVTPYSISRVGEIQMVSSLDANQALTVRKPKLSNGNDDPTDPFLFGYKKRNYLGLSNNIRYVGAIKTNDDFATAKWHGKDGQLGTGEYSGLSYQRVKTDYLKYHQYAPGITGNSSVAKDEVRYQKRNEGTARNLIGIASGYALRIRNVRETYNIKGKLSEWAFYGPIVGVAEIRLVNVDPDEAGGYVYADDRHSSGTNYQRSLLTTGNFVFPYVENPDMFVVDDCFPNGWEQNKLDGKQNSSHYWYLTGYHFYLNANISAFTYNSAGNPIEFESNSEIADVNDVEVLRGLVPIPEEKLSVVSWSLRSDHPSSFASDLEKRNYDDNAKDHSGYDLKDKYKLYVSISDKAKYSESEVHSELSMKYDASIPKGTILPGTIKSDISRLSFKLVDNADNTSSKYYKDHMEKPTKATLVLRAPAFRSDGNGGYVSDITKMAVSVFYTKNGENYSPTENGVALANGTAYYFKNGDTGEYEEVYDGTKFLHNVYTKNDNQYVGPKEAIGEIKPNSSNVFYIDVERNYTYTIYLNIQYIQGPSPEGNITIANCALPGEYIKADASSIIVDADQSMRPQNFYWRIGKLNAEGTAFEDNTPWKKEDAGNASKGYETWQVGTTRTGIFAECEAVGNNVLYIPAYYYMNGYGVQYGFASRETRENQDDEYVFYPIDIKRDEATGKILDRLDVHNFHLMASHAVGVDLRLAEAVERAKNEPAAQPRIYIGDEADIKAFSAFVSSNKYHGANAQFVLLNDLTIPNGYAVPDEFAGTLHGDGYVITGGQLFKKNSGHIYNLGVVGGKIANTNTGKYHCCFESNGLKVYDIDGNDVAYTAEDFKYGKVAYDLNQYNMKRAAGDATYTYVEDYYRNGDFQYARIDDETLGVTSGVTYLRKGNDIAANESAPYYLIKDRTAHNMEHTADIRSKGDHCEPLFEKNDINDYRFFGQDLQAEPELYPSTITSHKVSAALNRVWRTDGYYGDKNVGKFYYNAAIYNDTYKDTYVLDPRITAVNFNASDDNASVFHGFGTAEDVTRNLLVYTKSDNTSEKNEAFDVVSKALSYTEETPEAAIRGHHVIGSGSTRKASMLHLVDKQTFNAPIAFSVTGKSWYVRNPETETGYVEEVGTAWGSICLPFEVKKSTLSEGIHQYNPANGADIGITKNITFFYGTPAAGTSVANDKNTLRHHYWFREFKSISGNQATFERPDNSITNGGFAAYKPYIVSFPGSRFYEFDMTGQTITFENTSGASIAVTDDAVATANVGKLYRVAFTNEEASASKYAITIGETGDDQGMKFETNQPIYAFRGYMTKSTSGAKATSFALDDDVIYISTDIRSIESLDDDENSADVAGEFLRVYDAGNHTIGVESSYDTKLTIYTSSGQIARILDVRAGNSKYSGFASGIYIVGQKKLSVK